MTTECRYQFDGSFEGMLTAFAAALRQGAESAGFAAEGMPGGEGNGDLFAAPPLRVASAPEEAALLLNGVRRRISDTAADRVMHVWWAERPELFTPLYEYLALGFRHGGSVDGYRTHPAVRTVLHAAGKVAGESHRLKGLLRFRELADGSLYAPVTPDANVVLTLGWHFRRRLAGERWVIHDLRRSLGVFWDGKRLDACEVTAGPAVAVDPAVPENGTAALSLAESAGVYHVREARVQQLWRGFFAHVAIPERINPVLQRRCMPRRYWAHLVEKPQEGRAPR